MSGDGRAAVAGGVSLVEDLFRRPVGPLDALFKPRSVALIGATETVGTVGRTLLRNLLATPFGGTVYPVNMKRATVLGVPAYRSVGDIPASVDLAVIATPARTVPGIIRQCVERDVRAAVVISAGFREVGLAGAELEREILAEARRGGIRVVGPNCLGVMSPPTGLNATFAAGMAQPGNVAFLSQSGALLTSVLGWSVREHVGFSALVSVGSMLDVGWGELIDYFGGDPRTHAIVMYMESIGDARAFMSAAREVALAKPIVVIKAGRTEAASHAAVSHTGALTGADDVLDAAFRRAGVLRVDDIEQVFDLAEMLAKQPRPRGPRLTVITNAGGPGVLATDALIANGGELASVSADTVSQLGAVLPPSWSHGNPIDVLGDATPQRFAAAFEIAEHAPGSDGLLVILTPQDMTDPTATAQCLAPYAHLEGKPVLASWMGGPEMDDAVGLLNRAGIPTFTFPDAAARAFCDMWRYADNLRALYETPEASSSDPERHPGEARAVIDRARTEGRTLLDELEAKQVLASYGIPTVPTMVAGTDAEAVEAAEQLGFPVVLKVWSRTVTHKTDVGGVKLNLGDAAAVAGAFREIRQAVEARAGKNSFLGVTVQPLVDTRDAYELIVGSTVDPQIGPVLLFGSGGELTEVMQDRALALPPLTRTLARRLMEGTRIFRALRGVRGRAGLDMPALESLLVRFAELVVSQPWISEVEINPLLASARGLVALDARIVLHPDTLSAADIPRPVIRPYPTEYVWATTASDGTPIVVRPIRPDDEPLVAAFHGTLSSDTVADRYMNYSRLEERIEHTRLARVCFVDADRELVLVAEHTIASGVREIVAIGRLSRGGPASRDAVAEAEFALVVGDRWQGRGIGRLILGRLVEIAPGEGIRRIQGFILPHNTRMQRLCTRLGFAVTASEPADVVEATLSV